MKYTRFEELPVWNAAIQLGREVLAFTLNPAFTRRGNLRDQLERAAISVSNNIAEGFERGSTLTFLYIARGSAGEVRSMFCLIEGIPEFTSLKSEISNFKSLSEQIGRQLRAWADALQNSPIKGQRYLNEKVRRTEQKKQDRDEFFAELRAMQGKES